MLNTFKYKNHILVQDFDEYGVHDPDRRQLKKLVKQSDRPIFLTITEHQHHWHATLDELGFKALEQWVNANSNNEVTSYWHPMGNNYDVSYFNRNKRLTTPENFSTDCCGLFSFPDIRPNQIQNHRIDRYAEITSNLLDKDTDIMFQAITDSKKVFEHYEKMGMIPAQKWKVNGQWFYRLIEKEKKLIGRYLMNLPKTETN